MKRQVEEGCGPHSFPQDSHSHTTQGTWPGYLPVYFWPEPEAQSSPCERTMPQEGLTFSQNDLTYPNRLTVGPGRAQVPLGPCGWVVPARSIQVAVVGGLPLALSALSALDPWEAGYEVKQPWVESSRVREPRRTALPPGSQSLILWCWD